MLPEAQSRGWPPSNWVYLAHGSLPRRQYAPTVLDFAAEVAVFGPIEWENHHSETYSQLHRINKNIPPTPSKQKKNPQLWHKIPPVPLPLLVFTQFNIAEMLLIETLEQSFAQTFNYFKRVYWRFLIQGKNPRKD